MRHNKQTNRQTGQTGGCRGDEPFGSFSDFKKILVVSDQRNRGRCVVFGCSDLRDDRIDRIGGQVLVVGAGVKAGLFQGRFTAFVVFQGGDHRRFWRIFTRRGWRHCWIILPSQTNDAGLFGNDDAIVVDPNIGFIEIQGVKRSPRQVADEALEMGATCVIRVQVDRSQNPTYVPRGILQCVSLVKAVIGISAWQVWTPKHLARYLIRNGGQIYTGKIDGEHVFTAEAKSIASEVAASSGPTGRSGNIRSTV